MQVVEQQVPQLEQSRVVEFAFVADDVDRFDDDGFALEVEFDGPGCANGLECGEYRLAGFEVLDLNEQIFSGAPGDLDRAVRVGDEDALEPFRHRRESK